MSPIKKEEKYEALYNLFNKQISKVKEKYPVVYLYFNILNYAVSKKDKTREILEKYTPPIPFPWPGDELPPVDCSNKFIECLESGGDPNQCNAELSDCLRSRK